MIKIEQLKFRYHQDYPDVIDIPIMQLNQGDVVLLIGKSGSGKSTFINLLSGLLLPGDGYIKINNTCINRLKPKTRNQFRANHIGLISQQLNLIPYLSVYENIVLASSFQSVLKSITQSDVLNLMKDLKLNPDLIDVQASDLSVGQQQRVAIIRAIINKPDVILADEPTSALDHQAKESFIHMLINMVQKYQMTLIFISHDISLKKHFPIIIDMAEINAF